MGSILKANCKACGFNQEVYFGAGMSDFKVNCSVPVYNLKTKTFLVKNNLNSAEKAEGDMFYNNPRMFEGNIEAEPYHQWNDFLLKKTRNFCPDCKRYSLEFVDVGCFD